MENGQEATFQNHEERKLLEEVRLREIDLQLKRDELNLNIKKDKRQRKFTVSPMIMAIIAASSAVIGGLSNALVGIAKDRTEYKKYEQMLIKDAIVYGSEEDTLGNLRQLFKLGLINESSMWFEVKRHLIIILDAENGLDRDRNKSEKDADMETSSNSGFQKGSVPEK